MAVICLSPLYRFVPGERDARWFPFRGRFTRWVSTIGTVRHRFVAESTSESALFLGRQRMSGPDADAGGTRRSARGS
jgi:hypothetical protein